MGNREERPPEGRSRPASSEGVWYPRWFWPSFVTPATVVLLVLFVFPFYVIVGAAYIALPILDRAYGILPTKPPPPPDGGSGDDPPDIPTRDW